MTKFKNIIYLGVFGSILIGLKFFVIDQVFPNASNDSGVWFSSGLLLIVLGIFITEKYFTSPIDVLVNVITVLVVLFSLENTQDFKLWFAVVVYSIIVGFIAIVAFSLFDEEKDRSLTSQKIAKSANVIASFLGSSKFLFSIIFILSIFNYFVFSIEKNNLINKEELAILYLLIFWGSMILIEPIDKKLIQPFLEVYSKKVKNNLIGTIIKRQSPNIIIVEQYPNSPKLIEGDLAIVDNKKISRISKESNVIMFLGTQESDNKRYLKFYSINSNVGKIAKQIFVHSINDLDLAEIEEDILGIEMYKNRSNLVGFVHTNSNIDVLKIRMLDNVDEDKTIKEGDLLSATFYKNATKYQIINVETESESVDGNSKSGLKIITAQQIGYWQDEGKKFADMGWVPHINTPVYLESSTGEVKIENKNCYIVGNVPRSKYPIYIDLEECVTHHIAIIGKTGTGKSRMAGKVIDKMAEIGYKVVVFEVDRKHKQSLTNYVDSKYIEEQDSDKFDLATSKKPVISINWQHGSKDRTGGTLNLSDATAELIDKVITFQSGNEEQKICIVMEEAYDFIPENSFGKQDFGQPKVSRISQAVLKCRKHNIGFLIITQRTALVTKTILYQCHTIIALQSFDETTKSFMSAYINQKYLDSMSILPRFRAIVVGKGSSCDKPVIVNFYDKKADPLHQNVEK
jgi:uncharacterized protein